MTSDEGRTTLQLPRDVCGIAAQLCSSEGGIRVVDRWVRMRKVRRCFTGQELVEWLAHVLRDEPRENAVLMAQRLFRWVGMGREEREKEKQMENGNVRE